MRFKSSHFVFSSKKSDVLLSFTFQNMDLKRISNSIYDECYNPTKSKNTPYDPTSLLRLFIVYKLYFKDKRFFKDSDILDIPKEYLLLCGFNVDEFLPAHSTFYYFLKRIGYKRQLYYLNLFRVQLMKYQFNFFTCRFTKKYGKFIVFAVDSKPIEIDGHVPKGTIHSNNKRLNGKLGIKIHSIAIVYPFYFPILFAFTPGHYSDSTVFKKLFPMLEPLLKELYSLGIISFVTGDAGYDGIANVSLITDSQSIPCIAINPRNKQANKTINGNHKIDLLFPYNNRFYCINNPNKPLHFDGHDYACNKRMLRCYYYKDCKYASSCSKRFKIKQLPQKFTNESLLIAKLRLDIPPTEMYKFIYSFRKRIETIHGIWNNIFMLGNKFYFHNFKELFRFQLNIMSYSFFHFFYESKASVLNYFY